jgi:hypothetical protein
LAGVKDGSGWIITESCTIGWFTGTTVYLTVWYLMNKIENKIIKIFWYVACIPFAAFTTVLSLVLGISAAATLWWS